MPSRESAWTSASSADWEAADEELAAFVGDDELELPVSAAGLAQPKRAAESASAADAATIFFMGISFLVKRSQADPYGSCAAGGETLMPVYQNPRLGI